MDFVIIANAWSVVENNPTSKHQIAIELARQGHNVLWLDGTGMRKPALVSAVDRARIKDKISRAMAGLRNVRDNIWVAAPFILPFPENSLARRLNASIYHFCAKKFCSQLNFAAPTLINFLPTIPAIHQKWKWKSVYYCVDRWESFAQYDAETMKKVDEACMREAGFVVVTSRYLLDRARKFNSRSVLLSHGVEYEHFSAGLKSTLENSRKAYGDKPIIGFIGLIGEWVDQNLILKTAQAHPDAKVVLIGKNDVSIELLKVVENINIVGPKPYSELPSYMARFTVGIIPFEINDLTVAVNPIKLREMLAVGCPVVSTALPEVKAVADGNAAVDVAADDIEFLKKIADRLRNPLDVEKREKLSATMAEETWSKKVEQLCTLVSCD